MRVNLVQKGRRHAEFESGLIGYETTTPIADYDLDFYILTFLPLDAQKIMPLRQEIRYSVWVY